MEAHAPIRDEYARVRADGEYLRSVMVRPSPPPPPPPPPAHWLASEEKEEEGAARSNAPLAALAVQGAGAAQAEGVAEETLRRVQDAMGFLPRP